MNTPAMRMALIGALVVAALGAAWWGWQWLQTPTQTQVVRKPGAQAAGAKAAQASSGTAAPSASAAPGGLYRCDTPQGVEYRNSPCPGGTQQSKVDVVVPQGMTFAPGAAAPSGSAAAGGAPSLDPKQRSERCSALAVKLANVEKELAQPNAAQGAAWLREERARITAERGKLGCS